MATAKELAAVFTTLAQAYPNYTLPEDSMRLYASEWAEESGEGLFTAVRIHIHECKWFPTIAELTTRARAYERNKLRLEDGSSALKKIRGWKLEALSAGEAHKQLTAVTNAASAKGTKSIVPFRGGGLKRVLATQPKRYEVGAGETVEEFEARKAAVVEGAQ